MGVDETLPEGPSARRALEPGRVVAGRYTLLRRLGVGGYGEVWAARDEVGGGPVALKLLRGFGSDGAAWIRREIGTLRMLRIPGVVRLLDEGLDGGTTFIAMELVDGKPFPGAPRPRPWDEVEGPTLCLLETLARLHAEGVVHRDLKPDNILVDRTGQPTVLDFGIATTSFARDRLTETGKHVGTPAYLAPEQIRGEQAVPATDLYAVGVILFETLAGRLPHDALSYQEFLSARLTTAAPALQAFAPDVPEHVASTIAWLLRREPEDRPHSAADVLHALRREPYAPGDLPFLGRAALVARAVETLEAGRPFRLAAGPGMGKTRAAAEVAQALTARGRQVSWIRPGEGPYSAIVPLVGSIEALRDAPVARVHEHLSERLAEIAAAGTVFVVDDADRLDRSSAKLLAGVEDRAPVLTIWSSEGPGGGRADAVLEPLSAADLEDALFEGSNRLFHLREDAARELHRRTNGVPARIVAETRTWVRTGLARRVPGGRFSLDRAAVERLGTDLVPLALEVLRPRREPRPLPDLLDELLAWIQLADGAATHALLVQVTGRPSWEIEADVDELVQAGACGRAAPDRLIPLEGSRLVDLWPLAERRAAHARLARAMPAGTPGRLRHLALSAGEGSIDIVREALDLATRWAAEGLLGRAAVALAEGLAVARATPSPPEEEILSLLRLWVAVALFDGSTQAIDRVLYELGRAPPSAEVEGMTALARAALAVRASSSGCADLAESIPPLPDRRLDRLRQSTRVLAARRRPVAEEERIVAEVEAWAADRRDDPYLAASVAGWKGKLLYRQRRYAEAITPQLDAARGAEWQVERIAASLAAAAAAIEDYQAAEALSLAEQARADAAECRHTYLEGRAEYLARVARYRLEEPLAPDLTLVDLTSRVAPDLEALCSVQEAAFAYRAGDMSLAGRLALRASQIWQRGGEAPGLVLAEALALACGATSKEEALAPLIARLQTREPSYVIAQAMALLSSVGVRPGGIDRLLDPLDALPKQRWNSRLTILSPNETRRLLAVV